MKLKRLVVFFMVISVLAMITTPVPSNAAPIELKGITPWVASYDLCKAFFIFQEMVNTRSKGELKVTYLGGEEVVPPNDQFDALRNGVVDVLLGAAAYYRGQLPEAGAVQLTKLRPTELRKSGFYDEMRKLHQEKGKVIYLANTAGGNKFRLYSTVPLQKPDLTGLRFRVSPVYVTVIKALNGTPISMSPGDVYTGLERGVVQGYGWTYNGIMDYGWHEKTKYVLDHPFYSLDGALLINQNVWEKLPPHLQKLLNEIGVELEAEVEKFISGKMAQEDQKLKDAKLQFIKFSPSDSARFLNVAYDEGWKDYMKQFPDIGEKLRKLG
ncbi:MAG: TRAP transporter substrate-binding protein DctP, partial [Desulfobacterales bacterium]|nr:TRAP transporter substrate-binding protein DctP [Desulfobacterales bacterium]